MRSVEEKDRRRRRLVLLVGNAMLVVGVLIVTSPWTSGLYTWVAQRRLSSAVATASPEPREASSAEETRAAEEPGWQREDARDWRAAGEGAALARLRIPTLGLEVAVVKGVRDADLRQGPGWVAATSPPGSGNCGISGHRTTYMAPFRRLDRLGAGDLTVVETRRGRYTYEVTRRFFVARDDVDVLFPTREPTLTLTSCHPPYSDQFRIVVQARLVKAERR